MGSLDASCDVNMPGNSLLVTSLVFSFLLLILDFSFEAPRADVVASIIKLLYVTSIGFIMFVVANRLMPAFAKRLPSVTDKHFNGMVFVAVVLLCIVLAINIKTVGGLPSSPYASFLSSFPVFSMVMIFGSITARTCIKAVGLIILTLLAVELMDMLVSGYFGCGLSHKQIADFLKSDRNTYLAYAVLFITVIANVVSILFAQPGSQPDAAR